MPEFLLYLIPIVAVPSAAAVIISFSPLSRALAERLTQRKRDERLEHALSEQGERLSELERALELTQGRLDFTESLIGSGGDAPAARSEAVEPPAARTEAAEPGERSGTSQG